MDKGDSENIEDAQAKMESFSPSHNYGKTSNENNNHMDICRDFKNKICTKGSNCRYYHPDLGKKEDGPADKYSFCKDYQNQGCLRENCKFVHALATDVEHYKKTGDVTLALARAICALTRSRNINGIPICNDFQRKMCARGSACECWHIDIEEEVMKRKAEMFETTRGGDRFMHTSSSSRGTTKRRYDAPHEENFFPPPAPINAFNYHSKMAPPVGGMHPTSLNFKPAAPIIDPAYVADLERHNSKLEMEIASLRRELQREKERYDDLITLLRPIPHSGPIHHQVPPVVHHPISPLARNPAPYNEKYPTNAEKYKWN